jgi:hypothetical protein
MFMFTRHGPSFHPEPAASRADFIRTRINELGSDYPHLPGARILPALMWRHAIWQEDTNVSAKLSASFLRQYIFKPVCTYLPDYMSLPNVKVCSLPPPPRKLYDFHWTASSCVWMSSNRTLPVLGVTPEYSVHENSLNNILYILR